MPAIMTPPHARSFRGLVSLCLSALLISTTFVESLSADRLVADAHALRAEVARLQGIGDVKRVVVLLRNNTTVEGSIERVASHSFFVTDSRTHLSTQVSYHQVKRINAMSTVKVVIIGDVIVTTIVVLNLVLCSLAESCS